MGSGISAPFSPSTPQPDTPPGQGAACDEARQAGETAKPQGFLAPAPEVIDSRRIPLYPPWRHEKSGVGLFDHYIVNYGPPTGKLVMLAQTALAVARDLIPFFRAIDSRPGQP